MKEPRNPDDGYYSNLMKLMFNVYATNKEVTKQLIEKGTVVLTIMTVCYNLLVYDGAIDPIDSKDRKTIAYYLLNLI